MNTFLIADNKKRFCAIYQTDKTREQVLTELDFNEYDICITCEDLAHALNLREQGDYQIINIGDFYA